MHHIHLSSPTSFLPMERKKHCINDNAQHQPFCHRQELLFEDSQNHLHCCFCMSVFYQLHLKTKRLFQLNNPGQKYFSEIELICNCSPDQKEVVEFLSRIPTKSVLPIDNPTRYLFIAVKNRYSSQLSPAVTSRRRIELLLSRTDGSRSKAIREKSFEGRVKEHEERDEQFSQPKACMLNVIVLARQEKQTCESCNLRFLEVQGVLKISGPREKRQIKFKCWMCCIHEQCQPNMKIIRLILHTARQQEANKRILRNKQQYVDLMMRLNKMKEKEEVKSQESSPQKTKQEQGTSGVVGLSDKPQINFKQVPCKEFTTRPSP